ncbi:oligoribonuclease, mitochondrial-like [Lineus longissimus]|uniref:oligoribonuclease, mitochondrial-like n=1 Tax=Lineus longissimus TaxID=88925 RepID=UPI002B4C2781
MIVPFISLLRGLSSSLGVGRYCTMATIPKRAKPGPGHGEDRLIWVDCEMTGLDINICHLIEAACLITDKDLNIVATGPELIIHQPDEIMDNMNPWCKDHHGESGLTAAVKASKISLKQAEMELLSFVREHTPQGVCPLAGNSVHADKKFLDKYMPDLMKHFHYRIVDVSTIKELCKRWYPEHYKNAPQKKLSHRAMDDIRESIAELRYYQRAIFIPSNHHPSGIGER